MRIDLFFLLEKVKKVPSHDKMARSQEGEYLKFVPFDMTLFFYCLLVPHIFLLFIYHYFLLGTPAKGVQPIRASTHTNEEKAYTWRRDSCS